MFFAYWDEKLLTTPHLLVDGVEEGMGLNASHWPGNRTPAHLKADTTTGICLKLARHPEREAWLRGVSVVSNNHFDTDGLLSVYAALHPEAALRHEKELLQAARTGDFGEFTTPDAFKFDAVVTAFDDPQRSPIAARLLGTTGHQKHQIVYDHLLGLMPDLLTGAASWKDLWSEKLSAFMQSMMRLPAIAQLREHADARLTVIETPEPLDQMARFNAAGHHRVLTATRSADGWIYQMDFQIFSWFETVTPARGGRFSLEATARELDALERTGGGRWTYTGDDSLEARLYRAGADGSAVPSSLPLETVESHLRRVCAAHP